MGRNIYQFSEADARRFAKEQGIATRKHGSELQFIKCPYCGGGSQYGFDKDTFSINLDTGQFNCLRASCGAKGNMLTLARDFNFSLGRDVDEYYQPQRQFRDLRSYPRPKEAKPEAVKYLEDRGISPSVTAAYSITTHKDDPRRLCIPFYNEKGELQLVKYRNMDFKKGDAGNKEWSMSKCRPILFGMDHCDPEVSDTLILTEGQIDSLSVTEAGYANAVSVPNGAKGFTWIPYCWDFLNKFKQMIIFGDYENGKISLLEEMKDRFHGTLKHVRPEDYHECKDANEILLKHGISGIHEAIENAVLVENEQIIRLADVERKDLSSVATVKTGIRELDAACGGLYLGNLVILTGERGNGKSTLASQIVSRAIDQGFTSFVYSGELMDWMVQDWIDRQIIGPEEINAKKNKYRHMEYSMDPKTLDQVHEWYRDACYIYDVDRALREEEADQSIIDILENAIQMYGCNVLLIDNLMTAMNDNLRVDLYRQQGNFVRQLAKMAKKYDVLIILVAHPRKKQGNDVGNDDVLGSSNITNLADVVIWYDRPKEDKNDLNPPDRIMQVTKNRFTGKTINRINLWFNDRSKRISDDQNYFSWKLGWTKLKGEWENVDMDEIPF